MYALCIVVCAYVGSTLQPQWDAVYRERKTGNWEHDAEVVDAFFAESVMLEAVKSCGVPLPNSFREDDCLVVCYWSLKAGRNGGNGVPAWGVDPWLLVAVAWWETRGSFKLLSLIHI